MVMDTKNCGEITRSRRGSITCLKCGSDMWLVDGVFVCVECGTTVPEESAIYLENV